MFLVKASIRRPIAMSTLLIAMGVFGVLAFRDVGVDLVPSVDTPYVTVNVVYPGASPDEIESAVAKKVEDAVVQVNGIKHMTTTCLNNLCQVLLEFELDRDVDDCATDVREKISLIRSDLPQAVEEPKILKFDVNATPVVTVALTGTLPVDELYDYADDKLKSRFSSLPGVASVDLIGGMKREVIVEVDRQKLAARQLSLYAVAQAVGKENVKVPMGQIDDAGREYALTFDAEAQELDRLGDIEVGAVAGARVYLRDVATFRYGSERVTSIATYDGRPAVLMQIVKKGEANAVAVVDRVKATFARLGGDLPGGMELKWFRDDGTFIDEQVKDGFGSIWQGVLLTGFILLLFLADLRTALVAFVSIPVTMVIALASFSWFDYTMDAATMSALGISTGILVTNSIVVLESIAGAFAKMKKGDDVGAVVERASSSVALAVAASALTNVVVFLPIAGMKCLAGKFLAPFAVTVAAATFVSLFVSFTLTPILAKLSYGWFGGVNRVLRKAIVPWTWLYARMERFYLWSMGGVFRAPKTFLLAVTALCALGFWFLDGKIPSSFSPPVDRADVAIKLEFPADYALGRTHARAEALAGKIRRDPAVEHVAVQAGKVQGMVGQASQGSYLAEIDVRLVDKRFRAPGSSLDAVIDRFTALCNEEADVRPIVLNPLLVGGVGQQMRFNVMGDDLDALARIGNELTRRLAADPLASQVQNSIRPGRPELRFYPKREVLHDLNVPAAALGYDLRGTVTGLKTSTFTRGDRSFDVRVRCDAREGADQFDALSLPGPDGRPIPLGALAEQRPRLAPTQILRFEKMREAALYANPATGKGNSVVIDRTAELAKEIVPEGFSTSFSGFAELMQEATEEFSVVMVVAIVLTYLLLAAILESWTQPFIILLTVPFSYLGLFAALWLTGQEASIFSLLAGIMLIGVVVNAAILLIDAANTIRRTEGVTDMRALLLAAAAREFRPILMSMFAALFGMFPMAFGTGLGSELRAGIGVGAVGGILVSSVLSLYFIPAFCLAASRRPKKG